MTGSAPKSRQHEEETHLIIQTVADEEWNDTSNTWEKWSKA